MDQPSLHNGCRHVSMDKKGIWVCVENHKCHISLIHVETFPISSSKIMDDMLWQ
jgi:hypothetical protein